MRLYNSDSFMYVQKAWGLNWAVTYWKWKLIRVIWGHCSTYLINQGGSVGKAQVVKIHCVQGPGVASWPHIPRPWEHAEGLYCLMQSNIRQVHHSPDIFVRHDNSKMFPITILCATTRCKVNHCWFHFSNNNFPFWPWWNATRTQN